MLYDSNIVHEYLGRGGVGGCDEAWRGKEEGYGTVLVLVLRGSVLGGVVLPQENKREEEEDSTGIII